MAKRALRARRRWLRNAGASAALGLAATLSGGCESPFSRTVRSHTYPPEFNYVSSQQLDSAMGQLAAEVTQLDRLMRAPEEPDDASRREAIAILGRMDRIATSLGANPWPSNHPRLSRNLESFRSDIAAARRALEIDPPSYYLAGSVSGACIHCHTGG